MLAPLPNVPKTETLANFKANITPAAGATFEVYQSDGTTVATDLQTGYKLICTAEDGVTKKTYTITLNTTLSTDANILSYSINSVNGTINSGDHTIALTLPYGTNVTSLVATFTLSAGASAKVGGVAQVSGNNRKQLYQPCGLHRNRRGWHNHSELDGYRYRSCAKFRKTF